GGEQRGAKAGSRRRGQRGKSGAPARLSGSAGGGSATLYPYATLFRSPTSQQQLSVTLTGPATSLTWSVSNPPALQQGANTFAVVASDANGKSTSTKFAPITYTPPDITVATPTVTILRPTSPAATPAVP